jgi:ADP-ribosyl-[dinitrogen reductase] hydrolase
MRDKIIGSLLGLAIGDSLGLPVEGISRRRQQRLFPDLQGHRLVFW